MSGGHTPGPWQNGSDDLEGVVSVAPVVVVGDGNVICLPPGYGMSASQARWPENARLIAAAPDLLEALSWFINDIDGTHTVMVEFDANVDRARAAIAKATGK